jgi:hypothetical protein
MNDDSDLVDYIKQVRMILDDSMETLLNLKLDALYEKDDDLVPIDNVVELIDMSFDVGRAEKIRQAESELLKRQPI